MGKQGLKSKMKREEFTKQFKQAFDESGLSVEDVARVFHISLPTVDRWYNGRSAPHELGRESILDKFNRKIQT